MKILIFRHKRRDMKAAGRELLSEANSKILEMLLPGQVTKISSAQPKSLGLSESLRAIGGWINGLDRASCNHVIDQIDRHSVDVVYIDGSNFGLLARFIKKERPDCVVATFFHNVEAKFFWQAFRKKPGLKAFGVVIANAIAESKAVRYSDRLICLNRRDGILLKKLYGRRETDVIPMYLRPSGPGPELYVEQIKEQGYALFVGGAFYANLSGIRWFAKNVAPFVNRKTVVVGQGFEQYREELERFPNIMVVGKVASVSPWYSNADFVIAPIFEGSGMKTKVAEAMMYGKPIAATPEALVGYEEVMSDVGQVCEGRDQFIQAFASFNEGRWKFCSGRARELFATFYSEQAARNSFEQLLESLAQRKAVGGGGDPSEPFEKRP